MCGRVSGCSRDVFANRKEWFPDGSEGEEEEEEEPEAEGEETRYIELQEIILWPKDVFANRKDWFPDGSPGEEEEEQETEEDEYKDCTND